MNVLMVTPRFYPYIGGVEKHVYEVSRVLAQKGIFIRIVTPRLNRRHKALDELDGVQIHRVNSNIQRIWHILWKTYLRYVDIVHCHDYEIFMKWYLPFRFLCPSIPVFITFHGHEGLLPIPHVVIWQRRLAERLTKGNICVGDFIAKWYGTKPTYVTYGGVNCPPEISLPEPDLNTAVFIGRLEPDTGAIEYAQTVAQLKRRFGVSMTLRLCGDGSLRGRLQTIVNNLGIEAIFHGIVNSPERHFLQSGIAFVSSYLAILEAMAYRQLVCSIYTNPLKQDYLKMIPGAQDMMIISCNAEDLAIQLYTHLMNPEMAQSKIEKGYQFAQGHTWELVADTYCTLWARR